MNDRATTDPRSPEVTLVGSASATLSDLTDLADNLPGDTSRTAQIADRLSEELAEIAGMLRALPARPQQMSGHAYAALSAFRTAVTAGEDVGEFIAVTLARLAAELGSKHAVLANRPGSWQAALAADLMDSAAGEHGEHLHRYGASS